MRQHHTLLRSGYVNAQRLRVSGHCLYFDRAALQHRVLSAKQLWASFPGFEFPTRLHQGVSLGKTCVCDFFKFYFLNLTVKSKTIYYCLNTSEESALLDIPRAQRCLKREMDLGSYSLPPPPSSFSVRNKPCGFCGHKAS